MRLPDGDTALAPVAVRVRPSLVTPARAALGCGGRPHVRRDDVQAAPLPRQGHNEAALVRRRTPSPAAHRGIAPLVVVRLVPTCVGQGRRQALLTDVV